MKFIKFFKIIILIYCFILGNTNVTCFEGKKTCEGKYCCQYNSHIGKWYIIEKIKEIRYFLCQPEGLILYCKDVEYKKKFFLILD